jgi:hypothetical protein
MTADGKDKLGMLVNWDQLLHNGEWTAIIRTEVDYYRFVYTEQDLEAKAVVRGRKFSMDDQGEVQVLLRQQPGV